MKRTFSVLVPFFLSVAAGTAAAGGGPAPSAAPRPLRIVATVFPVWDWTREILGTNAPDAELTLLLDGGIDPHSYRPTAADLKAVAECDLFVHVGGESDGWVAPALAAAPNPGRRVLDLVGVLGPAARPEASAGAAVPDGAGGDRHDGHGGHEGEIDEHVWISPRLAAALAGAIAGELEALDPARADAYRANAASYRTELEALDADYAAAVAAAPRRSLVVADRFPFRHLADDYGLECFAAFHGCSAETEAAFGTILRLAAKADELGVRALLVLEGNDRRIAEAVRRATKSRDQKTVVFDSLQSVDRARISAGETYVGAMRKNLVALSEALR